MYLHAKQYKNQKNTPNFSIQPKKIHLTLNENHLSKHTIIIYELIDETNIKWNQLLKV